MTNDSLVEFLNVLLEAERAGARVLVAYMDDYPEGSAVWEKLRAVQRDEANNCAVLLRLIRHLGGTPSRNTGDFLQKALAIEGGAERLHFLNRGQAWVARKIAERLPGIADPEVHAAMHEMLVSHEENIAACDRLL